MIVPTKKVVLKASGDAIIINEADFDPTLHDEFVDKPAKAVTKSFVKPAKDAEEKPAESRKSL